jgi:hypothetical protein
MRTTVLYGGGPLGVSVNSELTVVNRQLRSKSPAQAQGQSAWSGTPLGLLHGASRKCGAGRPEANGDLRKWTADGLTLDGSACNYFQCRADLRGSQ